MKRISHTQSSSIDRKHAWLACVALVLLAGSANAATNFIYDIYQQAPSTFPTSPPWTDNGVTFGFINGSDSATASGRLLTLVHGPEFNDPGHYWQHNLTTPEISLNSEYEARARLRVTSYSDSGGERGLFQAVIEDGTRFFGFGASRVGGNARFFILDGSGAAGFGAYTAILTGDDFFNVSVKKIGITGGSLDQIQLYVDGVLAATQNYGNLGFDSARSAYWGTPASLTFGTVEMTGVSFGIDQAAPALLPEPSAVTLGLLTFLFGIARLRQRQH